MLGICDAQDPIHNREKVQGKEIKKGGKKGKEGGKESGVGGRDRDRGREK